MLAGKYEIIEVDKLAKVTFDLILSLSYGLALVLALAEIFILSSKRIITVLNLNIYAIYIK